MSWRFPVIGGQGDSWRDRIFGQRHTPGPQGQFGKPNLFQRFWMGAKTAAAFVAGAVGAHETANRWIHEVDDRLYRITFGMGPDGR